jgi:hypothetical protein
MTTLVYRGVPYSMEQEHKAFSQWWAFIHRPVLWLVYRGQKYRPCQNKVVEYPQQDLNL